MSQINFTEHVIPILCSKYAHPIYLTVKSRMLTLDFLNVFFLTIFCMIWPLLLLLSETGISSSYSLSLLVKLAFMIGPLNLLVSQLEHFGSPPGTTSLPCWHVWGLIFWKSFMATLTPGCLCQASYSSTALNLLTLFFVHSTNDKVNSTKILSFPLTTKTTVTCRLTDTCDQNYTLNEWIVMVPEKSGFTLEILSLMNKKI